MESIYTKIYDVDELLDRAYNGFATKKGKVKIEKPKLEKENKKSYIINFLAIAESINRTPDELHIYIQNELKIATSLKENGVLKIDKVISNNMIENIFASYIRDEVMCITCKSIKTHIEKEKRIKYLICDSCKCKKAIK